MGGVQYYTIAGRQVGSHVLAIASLTTFAAIPIGMRFTKGNDGSQTKTPPINATSKEEESFINDFIKQAEAEDKKAGH